MGSCTFCEQWTAHEALRLGLLTQIVPALKVEGRFVANPMAITDRMVDEYGRVILGKKKTGAEAAAARAVLASGTVDLSLLDEAVDGVITKLMLTFPDCTTKTIESIRKHKLAHWDKNKESNRAWLANNMMTEASAGFKAFNVGPKGHREVDFVALRVRLANGERWGEELVRAVSPQYKTWDPA